MQIWIETTWGILLVTGEEYRVDFTEKQSSKIILPSDQKEVSNSRGLLVGGWDRQQLIDPAEMLEVYILFLDVILSNSALCKMAMA